MSEEHKYQFQPSILRASRQIEREASHILYNENSLVRVSSCGRRSWESESRRVGDHIGQVVPILAANERARLFTRHTMEVAMLHKDSLSVGSDVTANSCVIAGDDLQGFCHVLLWMNKFPATRLDQLSLAIEVFPERVAAIAAPYEKDGALINGEGSLKGNCSIEATTSTKGENPVLTVMSDVRKTSIGESPLTLDQAISPGEPATSSVSSPRVLKLLKPLQTLHSLHGVHIKGPICDDYKSALLLNMLGPPPSELELFEILFSKFKDAISTYDTGDREAGSVKLKCALDFVKFQMSQRKLDGAGNAVVPQGAPYAGYTVREAQREILIEVWTKLAWIYLKIGTRPHVHLADRFANWILGDPRDPNNPYWSPPKGNEAAMAFYLAAHTADAVRKFKHIRRLERLQRVLRLLRIGLAHEPDNPKLKEMMMEKEDELKNLESLQKERGS